MEDTTYFCAKQKTNKSKQKNMGMSESKQLIEEFALNKMKVKLEYQFCS